MAQPALLSRPRKSKPSASPGRRICQYLLRLITRSLLQRALTLHHCTYPHNLRQYHQYDCLTPASWRPPRNTRTSHSATASRKQATANRLLHTRPSLFPEMPGLRTTMCPMISRYDHKAYLRDRNIQLTIPSSAAPSQKQPSQFACNSSERSTRS